MATRTTMKRFILATCLLMPVKALADTSSSDSSCGEVSVDCSTHKISFPGIEQLASGNCEDPTKIDCGANTENGQGSIGGPHSGPIVPDGVEIMNIPGMGADGGGKVFHTPNPQNGNSCPSGKDSSKGCIHVCKAVLDKLKTCKGAALKIAGAQAADGGKSDYGNPSSPGNGSGSKNSTVSVLDRSSWEEGFALRARLNHWFALGGLLQCEANAQETRDLVNTFIMRAHEMIDVKSYDPATRTYEVVDIKYWGQGPLITTPEELVKAIPGISLKRILRHPTSILRNQYLTDKDLLLLMPNLVESRRGQYAIR